MSLVGPRPVIQEELDDYYKDAASAYLSVRPGLTGLWQISGRNDTSYEERIAFDVEYARTWSVASDILILLRTFEILTHGKGAY